MMLDIAFIISVTLMYSTPLIFTSLGGVFSEKTGIVNIGLEGMMTMGAFIGTTVGFYTGNAWIGFASAGLVTMILALFHAIACVTFKADHVVSGLAMNFIGPGLALFMSRMFFEGATQTKPLNLEDKIPKPLNGVFPKNSVMDIIFNQYATVYLAFILVFVSWFVLYKTKLGLRIRAVGEHPKAADTLGIKVFRIQYLGVLLSGILAGFGGASMSVAVVSNFRPTLISGQGFIALAAVIFGKWTPQGAMWACLLFGAAKGLEIYLGRTDFISSQLLAMLPYIMTLVILIGFVGKSVGPAASGTSYEKDSE